MRQVLTQAISHSIRGIEPRTIGRTVLGAMIAETRTAILIPRVGVGRDNQACPHSKKPAISIGNASRVQTRWGGKQESRMISRLT